MRKETFRYRPRYGISRQWQLHIYSLGFLYRDLPEYADLIDEAITAVAPEYFRAVKKCIVYGVSPRQASYDYFVSERTLQYRIKRYYLYMYNKIKRL